METLSVIRTLIFVIYFTILILEEASALFLF